jgi:two-component system OmpR family response regulator
MTTYAIAQTFKVLIVDDEHTIADTFVEIFAHAGYAARAAYSAEAALAEAREWNPHAAIIDVVLPAMNGLGLAAALEVYCPECQILFFSGQETTPELLRAARTMEMNHPVLEKPIHPETLLDELKALLSGVAGMQSSANSKT